ncbi:ABC transporter permease [Cohnella sp. JJ-181]|uniref:ABC transporter permease n=1 Tax=Cohnella rhizoplanae TaxID=2974897 RepID=UPI0022FF718E|nr:ABC transporter permease [Cohnella sp. JJ-181]CAI6085712.1 Glutathione transport system permease protein GsiC [Cohnella sp. JJ-181]
MTRFIVKHLLKAILTIWFIVTVVFVITRMSGDPTDGLLPDDASASVRHEMRVSMGLDRPIHEQYAEYLGDVLAFDMGDSYYYLRPVNELFAERAGRTLTLGVASFVIAIAIGVPLGVLAAIRRNSLADRWMMGFSVAADAIPGFVLGILLIFLFSLGLRMLPSGGSGTAAHYVMPLIALTLGSVANIARLTRSSMLDVLRQDYLDSARARGVRETAVIFKHALRNALIPVVTIIGLHIGALIGGSVVVETVFSFSGLGSLIVSAAQQRDFPVIQYGTMLIAIAVTFTNLLVDLSYGWFDPRIRKPH